jgi:hypothetical protein
MPLGAIIRELQLTLGEAKLYDCIAVTLLFQENTCPGRPKLQITLLLEFRKLHLKPQDFSAGSIKQSSKSLRPSSHHSQYKSP